MPAAQFGDNFRKGAKKSWEKAREAETSQNITSLDGWELGEYIGTTTVGTGVYKKGARKGCDYISFDSVVTEGTAEGKEYLQMVAFGGPNQTDEQFDRNVNKVVKYCKSLFPDLADEITECASIDDFIDILTSDIKDRPVTHKFSVQEFTTDEGEKLKYRSFGDVLEEAAASEPEEDDDTEVEEDEEEAPETDEEESEEEDDYVPSVGDYVYHKPRGKRTAIEMKVVKVFKRGMTCNLEEEDGTAHEKVSWDDVEPGND